MFALIDCNNFFVSCERSFQPNLQHKPTLVLSCNDGCVIARSQEVKDLGIPMGIPLFKIKEIVAQHNVHLRSTNFKLYRDMSRRVMNVIKSFVHDTEVYSIDECFIQIPSTVSAFFFCKKIREEVLLQTGIPVSIGIAPTKTLAKLANKLAKSRRTSHVFILDPKNKAKSTRIFKETSVGEIWGIGGGFSQRLTQKGIHDVHQLISLPDSTIRSLFGVVGLRMVFELRGIRTLDFKTVSDPKKMIMSSRSFGQKIYAKEELWDSLAHHIDNIARELRQAHQATSYISIRIYTNRFDEYKYSSKRDSRVLIRPTNDTNELLSVARSILNLIYVPNIPYKKSGVRVSLLSSDEFISTPSLFESSKPLPKSLGALVDNLEQKHGAGSVVLGSLFAPLQHHQWLPKSQMKSPEYTTSWKDILTISKRRY